MDYLLKQEHLMTELEQQALTTPTAEGCRLWRWGVNKAGRPKLPTRFPTDDALHFYFVCLGVMKQQTKYCRGTIVKNLCGHSLCFNPEHYSFTEPTFKSVLSRSQLSPTEVALIRQQFGEKKKSIKELAAEYNRTPACIRNIVYQRAHKSD